MSPSTRNREIPTAGRARLRSSRPLILLLIYVVVSAAAQAYHGTAFLANNSDDVLNALGRRRVRVSGLDKLLIICVLTSASASTQTTILPTARTTLSMAKWDAIP